MIFLKNILNINPTIATMKAPRHLLNATEVKTCESEVKPHHTSKCWMTLYSSQIFKQNSLVELCQRKTFYCNASSANFTKLSNTLKQFVRKLWTNCLSVFDHFVGLGLQGLRFYLTKIFLSLINAQVSTLVKTCQVETKPVCKYFFSWRYQSL